MGGAPERLGWLRLALAPNLGPLRLERLEIEPAEYPRVPDWPEARLRGAGMAPELIRALKQPDAGYLESSEQWLEQPGHHLVTLADSFYPPLLRRIADAPPVLFVHGDPEWLLRPQIGIVGSRNATSGGLEIAREFSSALARAGLVVTSGLAAGIDGAAHEAALAAGGVTIAVAGTGPDRVYPARHRDLARQIVDNGAVISSFAPGMGPRPGHFPARNRIISGMSTGVVVIEAGIRSGSLITARLAGEQGREVFAVPGSIRNPMVRGCHRLIRQGARLVESADEIIAEIGPMVSELAGELRGLLDVPDSEDGSGPAAGTAASERDDDPEVRALLEALGHDPVSVDEIIARTRFTTQAVSSMLLELELQGRVAALGGGRYTRTGNDQEGD